MKKKIVVLNVILIIYILSMSVGYAIFSESLTVKGVATTVEYYSGTNLPVTAQVRDTTNNLYHTATGTGILEYESESWQDDTYQVNYIKNSTGTAGSTASFTVSFENAAVLDMSEGQISTDANSLAQTNNPVVIDNESNNGVVMPLILDSNSSKVKAITNTNIKASATISKTIVTPNENVDVTVTIGLDSLTAGVNESVTATVSYMLQNKIRYFYFRVNLKDACLTKGHNYNTVTTAPSYTGRGYKIHTCSRCGNSYKENTSTDLQISNYTTYDSSAWSYSCNVSGSGSWYGDSAFGGVITDKLFTLVTADRNNTGNIYCSMWTGPINLTDAKSVVFNYTQYSNVYRTKSSLFSTTYYKGVNTTYVGVTTSAANNTTFTKSANTKYTRTASSNSATSYSKTIDVSGLSGNYYIKVYVKHSYEGSIITGSGDAAMTGFKSIKVEYN